MNKGVRWHFVVLFLAASIWIASSLNAKYRQKRQLRNVLYLQALRNARYLQPIPIQIPPYFRGGSESDSRRPTPSEQRGESPWIPIQSSTNEETDNRNVYVPPIRPPAIIITRKPPKTSFDIPLTKTIQVSQGRPNVKSAGYVRKNLVKVYATRTTTENPRLKMLGTLAESTVQTILNFTPADEGWRPKGVAAPQTTARPNVHSGKNLGAKVEKRLNYTGVRFGKVNSVLKTMPQNGASVKVSKNETNFLMRFTPEDIRFASVEVKTEKIDTPFLVESPEIKHVTGDFDERRPFFDTFSDSQKTAADLRNEGNIPYQGHKSSMEKLSPVRNGVPSAESKDSNNDHRNIFDIISSTRKPNKNLKKEIQFPGPSFVNVPFSSEKVHSPSRIRNNDPNQRDRTYVNKAAFHSQKIKNVDTTNAQVSNDHRNVFLEPSNVYGVDAERQVKFNLPYQGYGTAVSKPPNRINSGFNDRNKASIPNREPQTFLKNPSNRPVFTLGEEINDENSNDQKIIYNEPYNSSPQYAPTSYATNAPLLNNKISITTTPSYSGDSYKHDSISNAFAANGAVEKDVTTVAEPPSKIGVSYDNNDWPNTPKIREDAKINSGHVVKSIQDLNLPKSHSVVSITHEDVRSNVYEINKNRGFQTEDQLSSKPAFDEAPNLKEVELKNPPKYLQFGDEDFLKPVVPLRFENERDTDKSIGAPASSSGSQSGEVAQQNSGASKGREIWKLSKVTNPFPSQISASKVEYYENSKSEDKKPSKEEAADSVYFQPIFPDTSAKSTQDISRQRFQNYNNEHSSLQSSDGSKEGASRTKDNSNSVPYDAPRDKYRSTLQKINKDVIITKDTIFSPEDIKRNNVQRGQANDFPRVITPPPVITVNYNSVESDNDPDKQRGSDRLNRTENYVIQRKPALSPESAGRPRKPKITISTGMLAGILIAALVFLGFLTGTMVYAFHQWKFGRGKSERQKKKKKKARSPGFPPEYLDENFAAAKLRRTKSFRP